MATWEVILANMARLTQDQLLSRMPLACNSIAAPTDLSWRSDLPTCETFRRFYALCDGGDFGNGMYHLHNADAAGVETDNWRELLREGEGKEILVAGRHVVFGEDSAGAPLIWDAHTDAVSTFWFKGGTWEPVAVSPEAFFEALFHPDPHAEPEWALAIEQISEV